MTDLITQVESERHHVVVDVYSATLNELMEQYSRGDLEIDPAYQRAFRWEIPQQTRYIESLLLNIPTPPFFLAETKEGKFEIIDGLQRFSTVIKFFANELSNTEVKASDSLESQNNIEIPSLLTEAPILKGLKGESRATLPDTLIRTLRYARVQVMLLKKESSPLARFHVFTRLNRAGSNLSNQEIRNCSARLTNPEWADKLLELANLPAIISAMGLSEKDYKSMGVAENLLRLLAFSNFKPTTQRVDEFLDDAMYKASAGILKFGKTQEKKIVSTFQLITSEFPNGEAFRFLKNGEFKGQFSTNLFDIVACGIYKNIDTVSKRPKGWLKKKLISLNENKDAISLTGAGSNTRSKMVGRVALGEGWFAK
jgi:Protein of unknown function DUF262